MSRNRAALWGTLAAIVIVATSLILPSLGSDGTSSSAEELPALSPTSAETVISIASILLVFLVAFVVIRLMSKHRADQH